VAIAQYTADFGYAPPDEMPGAAASHPSTPNECLVFFLATTFGPSVQEGRVWVGIKDYDTSDPLLRYDFGPPLQGFVNRKAQAYGTEQRWPYEIPSDSLRVWPAGRPFHTFVDPWGLPYFYNAPAGAYSDPQSDPQHGSAFDFFSAGPNGKTAHCADYPTGYDVRYWFDNNDTSNYYGILTRFEAGNDVDVAHGGNPHSTTYPLDDADDRPSW
jgi:hypothetical protein